MPEHHNELTDITSMKGNDEATYATSMKGNNEATFSTPMQGGNNERAYTSIGNTSVENYDLRVDLITTQPMPAMSARSTPRIRTLGRRELLLGGGVALLVLVGGGTVLTMALSNTGKHNAPGSVVPTVVPKPRNLVAGKNMLTIAAHSGGVTNALWDPTGRYLASAGDDEAIKVWDVGNMLQKQAISPLTLSQPVWAQLLKKTAFNADTLHWSADGRKLITLAADQNNQTKPLLLTPFTSDMKEQFFNNPNLQGGTASYYTPVPAPRGTTLAAIDTIARRYHKVDLWQMSKPDAPLFSLTYQDPDQYIGDFSSLNIVGWSCDGSLLGGLFSSSQYSKARNLVIWDVKTRAVKAVLHPLAGLSADMAIVRVAVSWSPVDPHLLAIFNLNTIAVVDASRGKVLYQLGTDDPSAFRPVTSPYRDRIPLVVAITWSPDGRYIAGSFASSNKVYLWDTRAKNAPTKSGVRLQQLIFPQGNDPLAHSDAISDISWSPDGHFLATASYDKSIKVWKVDGP